MQCPEVWNFSSPAYNLKISKGNWNSSNDINNFAKRQQFAHLVSVVLPDASNVPEELSKSLTEDCEYYRAHKFPLTLLLDPNFVQEYIKSGQLTALSVGTRIDCDNCLAITTSGQLILSLLKESYEELGIDGKPSVFCRSKKDTSRYLVLLDLKNIQPKTNKFERIYFSFCRFQSKYNFDIILAWNPPKDNGHLHPSSIATFLDKQGIHVSNCCPRFKRRIVNNVHVPLVSWDGNEESSLEEVFEWLGAFSLDVNLDNIENDFTNTYQLPEKTVLCERTVHLQWKGFFSSQKIIVFLKNLQNYISTKICPWVAIHVAGFEDAPLSPSLMEHRWYGAIGDNSYTVLYHPNGKYIVCTLYASQKLLKY